MNAPARTASTFSFKAGTEAAKFVTSDNDVDMLLGPLGPVSADTEFLTPMGWKRIDAYVKGDKIAQWDRHTNLASFIEPRQYFDMPCEQMWHFHNRHSLSMVLSDNHRCPVWDWNGNFVVKLASELAANPSRHTVPVSFAVDRPGIDLSDDDIRLAIAIKADGHMPAGGKQCVICVRKERKKERIRALLPLCGVEYEEKTYPQRETETHFRFQRGGFSKGLEPSWWLASSRQLEIILAECLLWDGLAHHDEHCFFTTNKDEADFIQYAAHATGRRASIKRKDYPSKPDWKPTYTVQITTQGSAKAKVQLRVDGTSIERVPAPNGRKYCFSTDTGFFVARHNDRVFITGNSGKSKALCIRIMRHAQEQDKSPIDGMRYTRFAIVRNTMPDLKRSTIRTWLETFPEAIYGRFTYGANMHHTIHFGDVRTEVDFISLDKAEDVKKLRSTEYTGVAFNELPFIDKELFDEADSRLRYPPSEHCVPNKFGDRNPRWRGILADGNAPDEDHWLATMAFGLEPPPGTPEDQLELYRWPDGWGFYKQPPALIEKFDERGVIIGYDVNPNAENLANLPSDYYQRQLRSKSKAWIDSRLMCRVALVVEGQAVWPMFRREYHVSREALKPVPGNEVLVALDFGRVRPAALFGQQIGQRFFIQYEMIGSNEPASVFAPRVKRFLTQHYPGFTVRFVGDPKGRDKGQQSEQSSYDIFAAHGMKVYPAPVKMNDIETRTEAVAVALNDNPSGIPLVTISPVCRTLIVGCSGRYHLEREDAGVLKPCKDKYSDICDCLQYWMLDRGVGRKMIGLTPAGDVKPVRVSHGHRSLRRVVR